YRKGGEPPRFIRFEDETTEAHAVVREIRARLDNPPSDKRVYPSDFAILFRTNEQPRAFEVELRRHQVPYVLVGGQSFYDRKEVRDVLAYLKVLAFPRDEVSLLRIINTPARGIGSGTVKNLVQSAVDSGRPLWEVLGEVRQNQELTSVVIDRVDGFRRLIEHYKDECEREGSDLVETVRELLQQIDYKAELQRLYDNPADVESRLNAIEEVVNALGSYVSRAEAPSLRGFLEEMALSTRDDLKDNDDKKKKEAVTLMTLHSAKGLEFPHVYMVGMEEGILPHQRSVLENKSVDEERRLAYVGVTRAQDTLTLTFCKGRMKWGKLRASIPSRFIMEMRGETERANRAAEAARAMFEQAAAFAAKKEDEKNKKAQKKSGKRPQRASVPPETAATTRPRSAPTSTSTPGALPRALAEGLSGPALGPVQDGFEGSTISLRPGASTGDADPKQRAALAALASLDDAVDQGLSSLPPEPAELARSVVSKPAAKPSAPLRSSRGPSKRPARGNPFDPTSTPSVSPRHFDSSAPTTPQASRPDAVVERVPAPDSTHLTPDPGSEPSSAAPRSAPRERQASRQAEVMPAHPVPTAPPAVTPEPSSDEERLRRALDVLSGALDLD
ncbi:MAG: ATP-binding domain-containing protein, partial [Myxococcales bacterium]|nr:ATP-binding domain-containing protein [Myxococcales bacterium]